MTPARAAAAVLITACVLVLTLAFRFDPHDLRSNTVGILKGRHIGPLDEATLTVAIDAIRPSVQTSHGHAGARELEAEGREPLGERRTRASR